MGMIQCEEHGLTAFMTGVDAELSKSIHNKLLNENIIEIKIIYKFDEYPDVQEDEKFGDYKSYCYITLGKFYKKALKKEYMVRSEEDEELLVHVLENICNSGICGKCFNEYVEQNTIEIFKEGTQ